jgi:hypothetical protein
LDLRSCNPSEITDCFCNEMELGNNSVISKPLRYLKGSDCLASNGRFCAFHQFGR